MSLADAAEQDLAMAHDAVPARDLDTAERALARAEALLRAHPELPNGSWLMAEVHRGWASIWGLPNGDAERASLAWMRAASLDGGRAPGVGETSGGRPRDTRANIVLEGLEGEDGPGQGPYPTELWIDGEARRRGELVLPPGDHQVALWRDGTLVWAEWVSIGDASTILIHAPVAAPCSLGDFANVRVGARGIAAAGVSCPKWVTATVATPARGLLVATCERSDCGELLEWRVGLSTAGFVAPTSPEAAGHSPDWKAWGLLGAAAVIVTGGVLVAAGAFRASPTSTEFVSGGLRTHALSPLPVAGE